LLELKMDYVLYLHWNIKWEDFVFNSLEGVNRISFMHIFSIAGTLNTVNFTL
jgi:hypothetical protein